MRRNYAKMVEGYTILKIVLAGDGDDAHRRKLTAKGSTDYVCSVTRIKQPASGHYNCATQSRPTSEKPQKVRSVLHAYHGRQHSTRPYYSLPQSSPTSLIQPSRHHNAIATIIVDISVITPPTIIRFIIAIISISFVVTLSFILDMKKY